MKQMIKKRTMFIGSAQPYFSKGSWIGAIMTMRRLM